MYQLSHPALPLWCRRAKQTWYKWIVLCLCVSKCYWISKLTEEQKKERKKEQKTNRRTKIVQIYFSWRINVDVVSFEAAIIKTRKSPCICFGEWQEIWRENVEKEWRGDRCRKKQWKKADVRERKMKQRSKKVERRK